MDNVQKFGLPISYYYNFVLANFVVSKKEHWCYQLKSFVYILKGIVLILRKHESQEILPFTSGHIISYSLFAEFKFHDIGSTV